MAQFEHLAEAYFSGFDYDLGERQLDYALQLDSDLDMFSAAIGLTKTAIQTIQKDDGRWPCRLTFIIARLTSFIDVVVEWGESVAEIIEPLQRLLDQCRGVKQLSKYVLYFFLRSSYSY